MTQYDLLKFKLGIKMRKEDDLSEFERGVATGARRAGLQGLQRMCEKEEMSSEQLFSGRKCLVDVRGETRRSERPHVSLYTSCCPVIQILEMQAAVTGLSLPM